MSFTSLLHSMQHCDALKTNVFDSQCMLSPDDALIVPDYTSSLEVYDFTKMTEKRVEEGADEVMGEGVVVPGGDTMANEIAKEDGGVKHDTSVETPFTTVMDPSLLFLLDAPFINETEIKTTESAAVTSIPSCRDFDPLEWMLANPVSTSNPSGDVSTVDALTAAGSFTSLMNATTDTVFNQSIHPSTSPHTVSSFFTPTPVTSSTYPYLFTLLPSPLPAMKPSTKPKRRFHLCDFVAVRGVDGREYYGQIQSFLGTLAEELEDDEEAEERFFCMRWLVPDKEAFGKAVLEGRDFLPSDFILVTESHVTAESLSSINRVFFSSKLVEVATSVGTATSSLRSFSPQFPEEMKTLWSLTSNPSISLDTLISLVSIHQTSHLHLFTSIHGTGFTKWLTWMHDTNRSQFLRYLRTLIPTSTASQHYEKITRILIKHFLTPPDLAFRVKMFMNSAMNLVEGLNPQKYGWCRLDGSTTVSPFSLNWIVKVSHVLPKHHVLTDRHLPDVITHMDVAPPINVLIPKAFWPVVFGGGMPVKAWKVEHPVWGDVWRGVEVAAGEVVEGLMRDYVGTCLKQVCERTVGGKERVNKELVFRFVEMKIGEEVRRRVGEGV
ncbi:hypothetical protein BC829DRAFT_413114 [Chytridium lagenaria]|nr:hypothetical protein BC829DRAFT_413114 [Chytridium lagenaria]